MSTPRLLLLLVIQPIVGCLIGFFVPRATDASASGVILALATTILWIAIVNVICFKVLR